MERIKREKVARGGKEKGNKGSVGKGKKEEKVGKGEGKGR